MEDGSEGKRRSVWFSENLWEVIAKRARWLSADHDIHLTGAEFIRLACEYTLEHDEAILPRSILKGEVDDS